MELIERFHSHVSVHPKTQCWHWKAYKTKEGYGNFSINGKSYRAHRFAYEYYREPLPEFVQGGPELHHTCATRGCVNPWHLELCESAEAHQRKEGRAKLSRQQVEEIRLRYAAGEKQVHLAPEYGVNQGMISKITRREIWKDI